MLAAADSYFPLREIDTIAPFGNVLCMSEMVLSWLHLVVGRWVSRFLSEGYQRAFRSRPATLDALVVPYFETHQQLVLRNMARRIGPEELAAQLDVPASLLVEWMNGKEMPMHKLIALARVVVRSWRNSKLH
jgi:hypothetical protein